MKLLLVLPISLVLAGCRSSTNAPVASAPPQQKPLKIALITPAQTNDPLSEHAHQGAPSSGDTIENLQASGANQVSALRDLATQKPDLLFCPSTECGGAVASVASKFPQTRFVVVGEKAVSAANVATLAPRLDEAAYLCGIAAGDVSKTGVVGVIGGANPQRHRATFEAFAAGARTVNPKIRVKTAFAKTVETNDFVNAPAAKTAAQSVIAGGADVLFHDIGDAGAGTLEAAQDATRRGKTVWAFGSGRNQNRLASDVTLGSATVEMGEVFDQFKESVRAGTFKPGVTELKISEETVAVEWNEANRDQISAAAWQKIDGAMEQLKKGALKIK